MCVNGLPDTTLFAHSCTPHVGPPRIVGCVPWKALRFDMGPTRVNLLNTLLACLHLALPAPILLIMSKSDPPFGPTIAFRYLIYQNMTLSHFLMGTGPPNLHSNKGALHNSILVLLIIGSLISRAFLHSYN